MTCWPVIVRELRAEARRPVNHWLRLGGATTAATLTIILMIYHEGSPSELGTRIFATINAVLFGSIWIVVPLLAADCISRERREGTLGLLFLTPLTPTAIVVGKAAIHALRSLTLFLVVLPVMTVPFLLGGVGWTEVGLAMLLDTSALLLALAAGILASALCKRWGHAALLALALSGCLSFVFVSVQAIGAFGLFEALDKSPTFDVANLIVGLGEAVKEYWDRGADHPAIVVGFSTGTSDLFDDSWLFWNEVLTNGPPIAGQLWLCFAGMLLLCSAWMLSIIIRMAASRVRASWQELPPPAWQQRAEVTFLKPRFWPSVFRSRMRAMLERNPIGWLQQRTVGARLTKWLACLGVIVAEIWIWSDVRIADMDDLMSGQFELGIVLLAGVAFSAASSFRQERENGALELILVTPLTAKEIVRGRLLGVWLQFRASLLILLGCWGWMMLSFEQWMEQSPEFTLMGGVMPMLILSSYATLPVIGLWFSSKRLNFILAWLLTLALGLCLPLAIAMTAFRMLLNAPDAEPSLYVFICVPLQALVAFFAYGRLFRSLERRTFAFQRAA